MRGPEKAIWTLAVLAVVAVLFPMDFAAAQDAQDSIVFEKYFNIKGNELFNTIFKGRIPKGTRFEFEIVLANNWDRDIINIVVRDTVPDLFGIVEYDATAGFVTVTLGEGRMEGESGPDYALWEIPFLTPNQKVTLRVTVESLQLINIALLKIGGADRLMAEGDKDPDTGQMADSLPRYASIHVNEGAVLEGIDPITGDRIAEMRTSALRIYLEELNYEGIIDRDEIGGGAGPVDEWPESQIFP
ncbi:hypothetical protein ACFL4G_07635 [Thermodesulfobacteriota bacterium]